MERQIQLNDIFRIKSSASSAGTYKTLVAILDYFELYYNLPTIARWRSITPISGPTTNLVAGEVYIHKAKITTNASTKSPLNIFAYNGSYKLDGKIYYVQLIRNNVCIANFILCYRKSDGAIGMYDIISDQFYTNVGTGAFTKGNDFDNYVTSDMTYTWLGDITLTAKWIPN